MKHASISRFLVCVLTFLVSFAAAGAFAYENTADKDESTAESRSVAKRESPETADNNVEKITERIPRAPIISADAKESKPAPAPAPASASGEADDKRADPTPEAPIISGKPGVKRVERSKRQTRAELPKPKSEAEVFYDNFLRDRLSIGARYSTYKFDAETRPPDPTHQLTFLGNINELEYNDDSAWKIVVSYNICPYLGLEFTHDEARARTWNFNNHRSDGIIKMSGPVYGVTLRLPLFNRICPYVGLGYAPWKAEFLHDEWWNLGYASDEIYDSMGRPGMPRNEYRRIIEVENDKSTFVYFGLALKVLRNLELDFSVREIDLVAKANFFQEFSGYPNLRDDGDFPLKFKNYSVALKAVF